MKVNIYYGGRGIMGDPTIFVIERMQQVLEELNVTVTRYDLHDEKKNITSLPTTLNDADGIILASTVEWYGIGGYMMEFLDACWLYGNKEKISKIYACPIVMSTTYGEREGKLNLSVAWEILGGLPCSGICGYVKDSTSFELNQEYISLIEKRAENLYRTVSQKIVSFPCSNQAVRQMVSAPHTIDLTPQETEQLSKYASDENYVQTQKEDIKELANHFKSMLDTAGIDEGEQFIKNFKEHFKPQPNFSASYKFIITDKNKPLNLEINREKLNIYYGTLEDPTVICKMSSQVVNEIIFGRMTFQRAFMSGEMQVKGDFKILRTLDILFDFSNQD